MFIFYTIGILFYKYCHLPKEIITVDLQEAIKMPFSKHVTNPQLPTIIALLVYF